MSLKRILFVIMPMGFPIKKRLNTYAITGKIAFPLNDKKNNKGFTLIEVMIASVILFSAVVAGSLALKTSFNAISKVTAGAYMAESLSEAVETVKSELEKEKTNGAGIIDKRISFSFSARKIDSGKNIVSSGSLVSNDMVYGKFNLTLYMVDLLLKAGVSGRVIKRGYSYKELVWTKNSF